MNQSEIDKLEEIKKRMQDNENLKSQNFSKVDKKSLMKSIEDKQKSNFVRK
jgi:hypothetical protein